MKPTSELVPLPKRLWVSTQRNSETPLPIVDAAGIEVAHSPEAHRRASMVVAGTPVDLREREDVLDYLTDRLNSTAKPLALGSVNLDHVHHFGGIERKHQHLDTARPELEWLLLADGMPIVDCAERLTEYRWPRITGADLLPRILEVAEKEGHSVGFLGGTEASQSRLRSYLISTHPDLEVSGWWAPERFTIEDGPSSRALAEEISKAGPKILVVSLGKPRQELWIDKFGTVTQARVLLAFGAATDFLAGTSKRAPKWISDMGFEWAYRLVHEPSRLAHRYLIEGPQAWIRLRGAYLVADSGLPKKEEEK